MKLHKLLLVDDEEKILIGIKRQLKGKYDLFTATSGSEALDILKKNSNFSVIISDYKMPQMNGVEFLNKSRELSPDSIRMMLTGQADLQAIIDVINEGNVFRFLSKPCPIELLTKNIEDAIEQYDLVNSQKELLSETLKGTIQILLDILILAKPDMFKSSLQGKVLSKKIVDTMNLKNEWQIEIASMLSNIGSITLPEKIYMNLYNQKQLSLNGEKILYQNVLKTSAEHISKIPRLQGVADIIKYSAKHFDGNGFPEDNVAGENIPLGSRILKVVSDYGRYKRFNLSDDQAYSISKESEVLYERYKRCNISDDQAYELIAKQSGKLYDDNVVQALEQIIHVKAEKKKYIAKQATIDELTENMFFAMDLISTSGVIIGTKHQRITKTVIMTLQNYLNNKEIIEPIPILTVID